MPTHEEIEESIAKLKNGRAPGEDNIIPEMIKYGGKQLVKKLHEIRAYANDIVIVARTQKKLTEVYLDLEEETSKLGMEIN